VQQTDAQLRQRRGQLLGRRGGGGQGQRLGLLDQRAHPVGLLATGAGGGNRGEQFFLASARHGQRVHRRAAGRQLVDDRGVEVGVEGHGQRARDGRGGHDQLVRRLRAVVALGAQRQALVHTETVLLVDHHQP